MVEAAFRTLEVIIQPRSPAVAPDDAPRYPVVARLGDSDQTASSMLTLPFDTRQLEEAIKWIEDGLFDDDYVREYGGQLFDALFQGDVRQLYRSLRADRGAAPRVRLIIGDPGIARVPWELLFDRERQSFIALDAPLTRGLLLPESTRSLIASTLPLRVLIAEAFPRGVPKVSAKAESAGISRQLARLVRQRKVEVQRLPNASLGRLQNLLRKAAATGQPFHVLHFIGHGKSERHSGRSVLLLETDDGGPQETPPTVLAAMLAEFGVRLVFLNACQSAQSSAVDLAESFAPVLLGAGIPCVIGMQVNVLDSVARQFADEFYAAVADNQAVDVALTHARRLALGDGRRRKADMAIPVCYLRPPSGQILELQAPETVPLTRTTLLPWIGYNLRPGRLVRNVYGLAVVVATVLGLALGVVAVKDMLDPGKMNGDFNIAVAAFGKLDDQGQARQSSAGRGFANDLFDELETTIRQEQPNFQVWGPDDVPAITGDTREQRQQAAQVWAAEHNVNLLIYGNVQSQRTRSEILPEFLVSAKRLPFAQELAGHYDLDADIAVTGENVLIDDSVTAPDELRRKLLGWSGEISSFARGLGAFNQNRYDDAQQYLAASISENEDSSRAQWRKVVNLFRGSAAGSLGQYDEAETYFDQALAIDPTYARALLGKAQMVFLRARKECTQESQTDVEGLQQALRLYEQASTVRAEPEAEIQVKVNYFSGAPALCLGIATHDQTLAIPLHSFSAVIDEYLARANDTDAQGRIAYLAVSSYIARGTTYAVLSNLGINGDNVTKARADFEAARELASRADRKAVASWWLARLHLWSNACQAADDEIARGDREIEQFVKANPSTGVVDDASLRCAVATELATKCPSATFMIPSILQCPTGAN